MIACPNCKTIQPVGSINTGSLNACPACHTPLRIDVFNAFLRSGEEGETAETVLEQGQAECYQHPGKLAVAPCSVCGRLLCPVCRVEMDGRDLCMSCLQSGRDKRKISTLQNKCILYDSIAINLSTWPAMMVFPMPLTAPAAIYFCIRHWRTPSHILPKKQLKNILAFLMASGQIALMLFFLVASVL